MGTFNQLKQVNNLIVGNQTAKQILFFFTAWYPQCSINEISIFCEIPPKKVIQAINYLTNNGFILRREGVIPGCIGNPNDDIYQYELFADVKRN